ncbi:hypothetical protein SNEBB_005587 [Seison nebaliae]|nr:hypothetical protein SNEBB_005587 [Seison nebaliae]
MPSENPQTNLPSVLVTSNNNGHKQSKRKRRKSKEVKPQAGREVFYSGVESCLLSKNISQKLLPTVQGEPTVDEQINENEVKSENRITPRSRDSKVEPKVWRFPSKQDQTFGIWSILKNLVGQELSKVSMPVELNEPLSFLQRLAEELQNSELLDKAGLIQDVDDESLALQLLYVASYAVGAYSTTDKRTTKPFNPLLGETYELDRRKDFGWRTLSEQVSHHPPITANVTEGKGWKLNQQFSMKMKFRGTYIEIIPEAISYITFENNKQTYYWTRIHTFIRNLIVGKISIEHVGKLIVKNLNGSAYSAINFSSKSSFISFNEHGKAVNGEILIKDRIKYLIKGSWNSHLIVSKVDDDNKLKANSRNFRRSNNWQSIWEKPDLPLDNESHYCFTDFAELLNAIDDKVAPTDSRNRPDQRLLEQQQVSTANLEKRRLENEQRARSKISIREPVWFRNVQDPFQNNRYLFLPYGDYWAAKKTNSWPENPPIF